WFVPFVRVGLGPMALGLGDHPRLRWVSIGGERSELERVADVAALPAVDGVADDGDLTGQARRAVCGGVLATVEDDVHVVSVLGGEERTEPPGDCHRARAHRVTARTT